MLQGGGSTTARDLLERAKQKKAEQDQADDTPQPVCVCQDFFRVIFSLPLQIYGSQCDERAAWGLPCLWREGVGKKCKRPFLSFLSTPVRGSSKGGGIEKKCKRLVLMFSCFHVLPLCRIPGLLIRFLGRLSLLLRLGIA